MNEGQIYQELVKICGSKFISNDPEVLDEYSTDLSFVEEKKPKYVIWLFKTKQIEKVIRLANSLGFSIIPISSSSPVRYHGDTIPQKDNCIIIDLSRMN